ncbi:2'-5' RNA ligase family protein [Kineococcus sp. TBRC 1896]|uniref:2'-5' RNA ligase family protein n=1 Tax=Kineococcus mangrovi TaxID=1660183 RepID=A0ABV4I410_9ACTN
MHSLDDPPLAAAPTRSAVIVPVPAAEHAVAAHRAHLDRSAGWGVPPHLTVLYPFLPPSQLNEQTLSTLAAAVTTVASFTVTFAATAWFGSEVLWLAPTPEQPLRQLTTAVFSAFPDHPPYGGAHGTDPADVQPHLTVGEGALAGPEGIGVLQAAEEDAQTRLPFSQHLDHALLITGSEEPRSWRTFCRLELGSR